MTYITAFNTFGREAYAYVAKEKGFFEEAGFDVEIKVGEGSGENMAALASGQAQFAPVDSTGYIITTGSDKVEGLTAVAAVHQRSMVGLMSLEGYGVTTPRDLEGKSIGEASGSTASIVWPVYAKLAGIDPDKVEWIDVDPSQVAGALATRRVDVIGQFTVGQPLVEKVAEGKKAVPLPYGDVLTDLYGHFLLTSTKLADEKPEMVQKFAEALLKGLEYAITNPKESAEILVKAVPTMDAGVAEAELKIMDSYSRAGGQQLGLVDTERVARTIAILEGAGAIPPGKKPEEFVKFDIAPKA
nr:ABC transporter substrate-binding protein [Micromonospora sp. DSM 115978]